MKYIVYTLSFLYIILFLNISLFIFNKDYNFFIKSLKYDDVSKIYLDNNITDEYIADMNKDKCICEETKPSLEICGELYPSLSIQKEELIKDIDDFIQEDEKIETIEDPFKKYSIKIDRILGHFEKYNLVKQDFDEYFLLFGLTDEYPYEYILYKNDNFDLYLFPFSNINGLYDMFDLLSNELSYTLNKVDLFGEESFFINTNVSDDYIRLIVYRDEFSFGLNIKRPYYQEIRQILEKM